MYRTQTANDSIFERVSFGQSFRFIAGPGNENNVTANIHWNDNKPQTDMRLITIVKNRRTAIDWQPLNLLNYRWSVVLYLPRYWLLNQIILLSLLIEKWNKSVKPVDKTSLYCATVKMFHKKLIWLPMITIFCSNGTNQEYQIVHFDDNQIMVSHRLHRSWWQVDVDDRISILVTSLDVSARR